jgi:RNA polymerase sigma-70 factor (ECF subfamily)
MPLKAVATAFEPEPLSGSCAQGWDHAILVGLERRESWAALALFDRLESAVERSLYRVLQQRDDDFEDLVQNCFERIVRTLKERQFKAECNLCTWASAIATHVAIDSLRARARERKLFQRKSLESSEHLSSHYSCGVGRMESRAEVERMRSTLAQMNPDQAQAVILHDVLGHDLAEIAKLCGTSIAAVQSRLSRGRKEFLRRVDQLEQERSF